MQWRSGPAYGPWSDQPAAADVPKQKDDPERTAEQFGAAGTAENDSVAAVDGGSQATPNCGHGWQARTAGGTISETATTTS